MSIQSQREPGNLLLVCEDNEKDIVEAVLAIQGVIAKQDLPPFADLAGYVLSSLQYKHNAAHVLRYDQREKTPVPQARHFFDRVRNTIVPKGDR